MSPDKLLIEELKRKAGLLGESGSDARINSMQDDLLTESARHQLEPKAALQRPLDDLLHVSVWEKSQSDQIQELTKQAAQASVSAFHSPEVFRTYLQGLGAISPDNLFPKKLYEQLGATAINSMAHVSSKVYEQLAATAMNSTAHASRKVFQQLGATAINSMAHGLQQELAGFYVTSASRAALEIGDFISKNYGRYRFEDSFGAELVERISSLEPEGDEEIDQREYASRVLGLLNFLLDNLGNLDPRVVNAMAIIGFFLALAVPIYQKYDGNQTEARLLKSGDDIKAEIDKKYDALLETIGRLTPANQGSVFYIVQSTACLKLSTKPGSQTIAILPPNQKVELKKRKGKWVYVEYFDYVEGLPKTGWVLKKYMKLAEQ